MTRFIIFAIIIAFSSQAFASEYAPRFRWTPPTQFVSGETLNPLTDLSEYRLYCSPAVPMQVLSNDPANEWQAPYGLFPAGDYSCYMTAVDNDDGESQPSPTVLYTVSPDEPSPIVIFTID